MQSNAWRALGTGDILGHLRADLKRASSSIWVVGPWIDAFFAQIVVDTSPVAAALRVITRPADGANLSFGAHATAARACFTGRPNTSVKLLPNLHAKLVVLDEQIVYCGSANWYLYSLQESREVVLRGPVSSISGLMDEMQVIWDEAADWGSVETPANARVAVKGFGEEVINPVAQAKLKEVPGSFIVRPRRR